MSDYKFNLFDSNEYKKAKKKKWPKKEKAVLKKAAKLALEVFPEFYEPLLKPTRLQRQRQ